MNSPNKFSRPFAILVVILFATLAISEPIPKEESPFIHVPAPGPGPWAVKSIQNISWWCIACKPKDNVDIVIIRNGCTVVFQTTGKNANSGTKYFKIDPRWAIPGNQFVVRVTVQSDQTVTGSSTPFTVFLTKEYIGTQLRPIQYSVQPVDSDSFHFDLPLEKPIPILEKIQFQILKLLKNVKEGDSEDGLYGRDGGLLEKADINDLDLAKYKLMIGPLPSFPFGASNVQTAEDYSWD
nr:6369_t:CDS:2 [Entrophospora candida]